MNIDIATTPSEYDAAIELFSKNFPLNYYDLRKKFEFIFGNCPGMRTWVVKDSDKNVVGALCLNDRVFNYDGID